MAPASCLVDTNILLRVARRRDPQYELCEGAVRALASAGCTLYFSHQNVAELWNVMTRPSDRNGFGLSLDEAERQVRAIEKRMVLLPESVAVYHVWRRLLLEQEISGTRVHDARLAASMFVHGVAHILTLNTSDFARYSGLTAIHPSGL